MEKNYGRHGLPSAECAAMALEIVVVEDAEVDACGLEERAWMAIRGFTRACAYHVGTDPPEPERDAAGGETLASSTLPAAELWAMSQRIRQKHREQTKSKQEGG